MRSVLLFILIQLLLNTGWAYTQGSFSVQNQSFISPYFERTSERNFLQLGFDLQTRNELLYWYEQPEGFQTSLNGQVFPTQSLLNYVNIEEMYWGAQGLSFGRKKWSWSDADERLNLGLYQPQFTADSLSPRSQGLVGFFYNWPFDSKSNLMGLMLYGSPFFIPNQGAAFDIQDGHFEAANPFFQAPPDRINIQGQQDSIYYQVTKPDLQQIVLQSSYAAQFYFGQKNQAWSGQISMAQKPMNQLNLGFKGYLTTKNSVHLDILPAVMKHTLLSFDSQYVFENKFFIGVGTLIERPQAKAAFSEEWTYARYTDLTLSEVNVGYMDKVVRTTVSYLDAKGGSAKLQGSFADSAGSFVTARLPFAKAIAADFQFSWSLRKFKKWIARSRYLMSTDQGYQVLNSSIIFQFDRNWQSLFSTQLIQADLTKNNIYSNFAQNDSVHMGIQYVF